MALPRRQDECGSVSTQLETLQRCAGPKGRPDKDGVAFGHVGNSDGLGPRCAAEKADRSRRRVSVARKRGSLTFGHKICECLQLGPQRNPWNNVAMVHTATGMALS